MPSYGPYQTERELASTSRSSVFLAHKTGEPPETKYAVKVFLRAPALEHEALSFGETPVDTGSQDRPETAAAEVQARLASQCPLVLSVLEQGIDEQGRWAVTPFCPLSFHRLIVGKATLPPEVVYHLVQSAVAALAQLKAKAGRGHGNLKASNLLLTSAAVRQARVLLADPAPDEPSPGAHELADLRALGLILYQLVYRREITDDASWLILPVEMSREWTVQFGKAAPRWLELCNRLLDRRSGLEQFNLGLLESQLQALAPKPAVSRRTLAYVTIAIILLAGGGGGYEWLQRFTSLQVTSDPPGAAVVIDGTLQGRAGTAEQPWKVRLRKGPHTIVGSLPGLTETRIERGLSNATELVQLRFNFASLALRSEPAGAAVEIETEGGVTKPLLLPGGGPAVTPCEIPYLPPGPIRLHFVRDRYETFSTETNLALRQAVTLQAQLKERVPGQVEVKFHLLPEDVSVIDEKGQVRVERAGVVRYLSPGPYRFVAKYPGWPRTLTNDFNLVAGMGSTNFQFRFPNTKVTYAVEPEDAIILADGQPRSRSRAFEFFPVGPMRFTVTSRGFKTNEQVLILRDRVPETLTVKLDPHGGLVSLRSPLWPVEVYAGTNFVGRITNDRPPQPFVVLPEGTHRLTARYGDLLETNLTLQLTNAVEASGQFDFDFGVVRLASDPPGADFQWRRGGRATPVDGTIILPSGPHQLMATLRTKPRLQPITRPITVNKGATNLEAFAFKFASLIVTSQPPSGVEVLDGDKVLGTTPLTIPDLPLGPGRLDLSYERRRIPVPFNLADSGTFTVGANCELPLRFTNSLKMIFVLVPGTAFYVGEFEVRQREFTNVVTDLTPAERQNLEENPDLPMTQIGWDRAQKFCQTLTSREATALAAVFGANPGYRYALPTIADWTNGILPSLVTNAACLANSVLNLDGGLQPVATGRASSNSFGVYDLVGNVAEWCTGPTGAPIKVGRSYNNFVKLTGQSPAALDRLLKSPNAPANEVQQGAGDIGFRCYLQAGR